MKAIAKKEGKQFYFGRFVPHTKYMFIAEMPTPDKDWNPQDNFNISGSDKKFIEMLNANGFGGSYVTDLVKKAENARRPKESELSLWLPILKKEIEILKPEVVVAVGPTSAYLTLSKYKSDLGIKNLECIWHPSYVQRYNRWDKYVDQLRKLAVKYT